MAQLPIVRAVTDVYPRGEYAGTGKIIAKGKTAANLFHDWAPAIAAYDAGTSGGVASRWVYTPLGIIINHRDDSAISASTLEAYLLAFT